jgi:hypothetical protein
MSTQPTLITASSRRADRASHPRAGFPNAIRQRPPVMVTHDHADHLDARAVRAALQSCPPLAPVWRTVFLDLFQVGQAFAVGTPAGMRRWLIS